MSKLESVQFSKEHQLSGAIFKDATHLVRVVKKGDRSRTQPLPQTWKEIKQNFRLVVSSKESSRKEKGFYIMAGSEEECKAFIDRE